MNGKNLIGVVVVVLAIIGAINWGLIGFFNYNVVGAIFGGDSHTDANTASRVVYAIVGLCGLASLYFLPGERALPKGYRTAAG